MAKIIALDIGEKRTGLAETDQMQIISSPLQAVSTSELLDFLIKMKVKEDFEAIVLGDPISLQGGDSDNSKRVREWEKKLIKTFPDVMIYLQDERFSSKMAVRFMVESGMKKGRRRQKGEVDRMSAAVILQSFLENRNGNV